MYETYGSRARRGSAGRVWLGVAIASALVVALVLVVVVAAALDDQSGGGRASRSDTASDTVDRDADPPGDGGGSQGDGGGSQGDGSQGDGGQGDGGQGDGGQGDGGGRNDDGQGDGDGGEEQGDGEQAGGGEGDGDGDSNQPAPLTFTLDLEGYVPYGDRYAVRYTVNDGSEGVHGFCGHSESNRCRSDKLYTASLPGVRAGDTLDWYFTWFGSSDFTFGHAEAVVQTEARTVAYTCTYPPSPVGNARPDCVADRS